MDLRGIDKSNFVHPDFEYFDCIICSDVAVKPKMCAKCEHIFCSRCIKEWMSSNTFCPFKCQGKAAMTTKSLPSSVKNLYGKLRIHCPRAGCWEEMALKDLLFHEMDCGVERCSVTGCKRPVRYNICGMNICGEKCAIYTLIRVNGTVAPELLFGLLDRFTKNARYQSNNKANFCYSIPCWERSNLAEGLELADTGHRIENKSGTKEFKSVVGSMVS